LIGPYHHIGAQFGVIGVVGNVYDSLAGMQLDEVAKIDITEVRYQWFGYIFKHGPKPALLADKVNYQVTGANLWKHAPSLAAMSDQKMRLYFSAVRSGEAYRLGEQKPADDSFATLKVDLRDRSDVDRKPPGGGVVDTAVDTWTGLQFVSDPLPAPTEMSGLFSGRIDFVTNKRDFDFEIDLYEQTPKGEYVQLTSYWTRASYIADRTQRHLLTPGKRQQLDFEDIRLMSRQLQAGSRVVAVLSVIKEPGRQINYGTGKDVSDETIPEAGDPLQIQWYGDSYLDLPVSR
jgi:predicted acyl esterase